MRFIQVTLRNEVAKRWPVSGWIKSMKVKKKIDVGASDTIIYEIIMKKEPALIGRLGGTEARFLWEYRKLRKFGKLGPLMSKARVKWRKRTYEMNTIAGFFYEDLEDVKTLNTKYDEALKNTDILGAWGTAFTQIELEYYKIAKTLITVDYTAPWIESRGESHTSIPWAQALQNKNILVVSPFEDTIQKQFNIIDNVFPGYSIHNFNLLTLKAPMTVSTAVPANKSWFEILADIESAIAKVDFDVLLVSAGAFSYPLAHFAKKMGKIGIHCGGGLQLFFGIMGKRWENSSYLNGLQIGWVRPAKHEKPVRADLVEDGCYW